MHAWQREVELAQLTLEKHLDALFADDPHVSDDDSDEDANDGAAKGAAADAKKNRDQQACDTQPMIRLSTAFARACEEAEDGNNLGLARNVSVRMMAALFADGARRWQAMEMPPENDEALASLSPPPDWCVSI